MTNNQPIADLIIQNAAVYTVDENNPRAEAVAIKENQIIFVGSNIDVTSFAGESTRIIEGNGRSLLPGFIDSHFHLAWGAKALMDAQLAEATSLEEVQTIIEAWKADNPDKPWILGQGLSYAIPSDDIPLTRHYLDRIEPERPLALTTFDVHSTFVNTAALEAMDLTKGVATELENGVVVVDGDGYATGELYEMDAMGFVDQAQSEPTLEESIEMLQAGLALCAQHGITSVHNMDGDFEQAKLYAKLDEMGELTLRVYIPYWVKPGMTVAQMEEQALLMRDTVQTELVRSNCVKFFMDGVYESYTAVNTTGYPDQPDNFGDPIWDAQTFAQFTKAADKLRLQIFVHACGDGAVQRVLDGFETAATANGQRDSRHRVEPRFRQLGVIASMQPLHAPIVENDPDVWPQRIHRAEWDRAFAWRTLREQGATIAFGSDWPVVTLSPILGIWGAVTRFPLADDVKSHVQTLEETICSYTKDAAFAEFQEGKKGQLKVGMWADLVLLSEDIFNIPPDSIKDINIELTVSNGRIVYQNRT